MTSLSVKQARIRRFSDTLAFRQFNTDDAAASLGFSGISLRYLDDINQ